MYAATQQQANGMSGGSGGGVGVGGGSVAVGGEITDGTGTINPAALNSAGKSSTTCCHFSLTCLDFFQSIS